MLARLLITGALLLGIVPSAHAQSGPPWDVGMTRDGRADFGVLPAPEGHDLTVHRCPGGGACGGALKLRSPEYSTTRWVDPRAIEPGDVMEVRYLRDGQVVEARRTPPWRGTPRKRTRPLITGAPATGQVVKLTAGAWTHAGWAPGWAGGWRNATSTRLLVCRTAAGTGCEQVSEDRPLDEFSVGRYLFAETGLFFWAGQIAGTVLGPVEDLEPPGPLGLRSRPVGPVAGPVAIDLRARPLERDGRLTLGRVRCAGPCRVRLTISDGRGHEVRRVFKGSARVRVKDRFAGPALIAEAVVDGRPVAGPRVILDDGGK